MTAGKAWLWASDVRRNPRKRREETAAQKAARVAAIRVRIGKLREFGEGGAVLSHHANKRAVYVKLDSAWRRVTPAGIVAREAASAEYLAGFAGMQVLRRKAKNVTKDSLKALHDQHVAARARSVDVPQSMEFEESKGKGRGSVTETYQLRDVYPSRADAKRASTSLRMGGGLKVRTTVIKGPSPGLKRDGSPRKPVKVYAMYTRRRGKAKKPGPPKYERLEQTDAGTDYGLRKADIGRKALEHGQTQPPDFYEDRYAGGRQGRPKARERESMQERSYAAVRGKKKGEAKALRGIESLADTKARLRRERREGMKGVRLGQMLDENPRGHRGHRRTRRNGAARFYFYDAKTGRELTGHRLNGIPANGTGALAADRRGRRSVRGMKLRHTVYAADRRGSWAITADDFGGKAVIAKFWVPPGPAREFLQETFWLTPATSAATRVNSPRSRRRRR